jgi:hypothetical protein
MCINYIRYSQYHNLENIMGQTSPYTVVRFFQWNKIIIQNLYNSIFLIISIFSKIYQISLLKK